MPATRICLNMIVRNEAAIIERCLRSVADHVVCWVICDTGSTDGTPDLIRSFFARRGIPGTLHTIPFQDFEQARNEALDLALASPLAFDYVMLTDADMEFVATDLGFTNAFDLPGYIVLQRSMSMYWNVRFMRRDAAVRYEGVTHECLSFPPGDIGIVGTAWFVDHACGSNRRDKYERDIRLLRAGLEREPDNSRYWFYLGQSFAGSCRWAEAIEAYGKRIAAGGWGEEAWMARLQQARCHLNLGDTEAFTRTALLAFEERPHRLEPLYELAKMHREIGRHAEALAFAEAGLTMSYPPGNDTLFVEDWIYDRGIRLEYAMAAVLAGNAAQRERGHALCEWLALTPHDTPLLRDHAHETGGFYAPPAASLLPTLRLSEVRAPAGTEPGNPSVVAVGSEILLGIGPGAASGAAGATLLRLDADLAVTAAVGIASPVDPAHPGLGGVRLLAWRGGLWAISTSADPDENGVPRRALSRLATESGAAAVQEWHPLPSHQCDRGNLIPQANGDDLRLVVGLDPVRVLGLNGGITTVGAPLVLHAAVGSTPMLPFEDGWLCLVREVGACNPRATHRFLLFDRDHALRRLSRRFALGDGTSGTVAGLAWHPDGCDLLFSFGLDDGTAWIARASAAEVGAALADVASVAPPGVKLVWAAGARTGTPAAEPAAPAENRVPAVRSFDLFDTLVARRCVHPTGVFARVERLSGHAGFARLRVAAEAELLSGPYTLDLIYAGLVRGGVAPAEAERLKRMEIEAEHAELFPVAQHCAEVGRDDIVVSDMYLPVEMLRDVVHRTCDLPGRRVVVTANGKHFGTVWPAILTVQPVREHLGDNPHSDGVTPRRAGIPGRITRVADRMEVETQLADAGFEPLSNLMREARLSTWLADPALRRAQVAQFELNVPIVFLATLHLLQTAEQQGWDHILFSGRDCWLWVQLYDALRPLRPGMPSGVYFHTNRGVRLMPSESYLAYFDQLRAGRRNVVVDLCGTGVTTHQLIALAGGPHTDSYLVHHLAPPHERGKVVHRVEVSRRTHDTDALLGRMAKPLFSAFCRMPRGGDNDVLEDLNRAPYPALDDMRVTENGFEPIFSGIEFRGAAAQLFSVHQAAFRRACALVPTLSRDALGAMLGRDALPTLLSIYDRLPGLLSELVPFFQHKLREENVLVQALDRHDRARTAVAAE